MKKLLIAAALPLLLLLGGCVTSGQPAASPEVRWAQAASAFNAAVKQAVAARRPCVEFGPDAPDCLITDAHYPVVNMAIMRGATILDAVGQTTPVASTADALLAIAAEIVAAIPVKR